MISLDQGHERSCLGRCHTRRTRQRDQPLIEEAQEAQQALDCGTDGAELRVELAKAKLKHAGLPLKPWPPPTPPLYSQPQGTSQTYLTAYMPVHNRDLCMNRDIMGLTLQLYQAR